VRRAGSGRLPDGARVTWTVADGARGRRWREAITDAAGIRHSLLLETGPDRRFAHLELSTPAGLLTLHPEADGTLHGNVVDAAGVRHVVGLSWDPDGLVDLEGSAITAAACAWRLDGGPSASGMRPVIVLRVSAGLGLEVVRASAERLWEGSWRLGGRTRVAADADGAPVPLEGESWPLELA
jgi:hypothetical protein